jgi:uncharacterized protein YqeY
MTLEQRLTEDMKDAMRAKDELKLSVIRMLRGQILLEKKKGTGVTDVPDDVVVALVRGHVKRLKETIEQMGAAGRNDLADAAKAEIAIAQVYLPAEMPQEELDALVTAALAETGVSDVKGMGQVMKVVMAKVAGRTDGRRVQDAIKRALGA